MFNGPAKAPGTVEEIVHLGGDKRGISSQFMGVNPTASVTLRYKGRFRGEFEQKEIECEYYASPDGSQMIHTMCVRCGKPQTIKGELKAISYDKNKGLFVEPFTCTWELEGDRRIEFGLGMCYATVAYDGKFIKDA